MLPLVQFALFAMCSNFRSLADGETFTCSLKSDEQLKAEVYKNKVIRVLTFDGMPLNGARKNEKGELVGQGVAFDLITTLQEKFGFKYTLEKVPPIVGDDSRGALGKLVTNEADMIAAFIPVLPDTNEYMEWGTDLGQASYNVMLKRPADSNSGSGLLAPFDTEVWLLTLVSLVIVGPVFYGVMWLRIRLCPCDEIDELYPLTTCVWFVYGALMKQGSTLNPMADSARMIFATWWVFILILTAFYTANLTAFLTLSIPTLPIKEIDDVAKDGNHWFTTKGGLIDHAVKNKDDQKLRTLRESAQQGRGTFLETMQESAVFQRILSGEYYLENAYFMRRMMFDDYRRKSDNGVDESLRCAFVLADKEFLVRSLAFAYPKDSALPQLFNPVLRRFIESGILQHQFNLDLPDAIICPKDLGNKERKLRNSDLWTTYVVVLGGMILALLIFLGELGWSIYNKQKKKRQGSMNMQLMFNSRLDADKLLAIRNQVEMKINGKRRKQLVKLQGTHFIPLDPPSTLLFQYT